MRKTGKLTLSLFLRASATTFVNIENFNVNSASVLALVVYCDPVLPLAVLHYLGNVEGRRADKVVAARVLIVATNFECAVVLHLEGQRLHLGYSDGAYVFPVWVLASAIMSFSFLHSCAEFELAVRIHGSKGEVY